MRNGYEKDRSHYVDRVVSDPDTLGHVGGSNSLCPEITAVKSFCLGLEIMFLAE
jgi:hypothetical protein